MPLRDDLWRMLLVILVPLRSNAREAVQNMMNERGLDAEQQVSTLQAVDARIAGVLLTMYTYTCSMYIGLSALRTAHSTHIPTEKGTLTPWPL